MLLPVFECGDLRENRFKLMTLGKIVKYCKKGYRLMGHKLLFLSLSSPMRLHRGLCLCNWNLANDFPPSPSKKKKKNISAVLPIRLYVWAANCCFSLNLRWRTNRWTGQGTSRERKRNAGQRVRTKQHRKTVRRERSKRPRRETRVSISLV